MKILHLTGGNLASGAGRGAHALHKGLVQLGVQSRFLGRLRRVPPADVDGTRFPEWQRILVGACNRLYLSKLRRAHGQPDVLFHPISYGYAPHRHPLIGWADALHVQWAHAPTFGPGFWRSLPHSPRPVVFTLRDMWLFTGGCHFADDCHGFETDCGQCPMLPGPPQTITARDLAFKRETVPKGTTFVAISKLIADAARRSAVLREADIRVIPNCIDTGKFSAIDKGSARRQLGLPTDAFIIGFGALNLSERRKGAEIMQRAIAMIGNANEPGPSVHWAVFGGEPFPLPENATWFGLLDDNARLNLIMAAADVFIMPSLQESFGKTTAEALASATPVIAFDQTPAEEIVDHGRSGFVVPHGDAGAVVDAIRTMQAMPRDTRLEMGRRGHENVEARYSPAAVARQHVALYSELIEARRAAV